MKHSHTDPIYSMPQVDLTNQTEKKAWETPSVQEISRFDILARLNF